MSTVTPPPPPAQGTDEQWYFMAADVQIGPVGRDGVAQRITSGSVDAGTLVWADGQQTWAPLRDTALAPLLRTTALTPPPPPGAVGASGGPSAPPSPAAPPDAQQVSDGWAWAVCAVPLLMLIVSAVMLPVVGIEGVGVAELAAGLVLNTVFALADQRQLAKAGRDDKSLVVWAALIVPVYLYRRDRVLGLKPIRLGVWVAVFVLSFTPFASELASGIAANEIDSGIVEDTIEEGVLEQAGLQVTAECPAGIPARRGETFECVISGGGETGFVEVRVQTDAGDIVWQVR